MPENEEEPEHAPEFDEAMMKTGHDGLSEKEAAMRLKMYGRNELPDMSVSKWEMFLSHFTGIMPGMIIAAICIEGLLKEWPDFYTLLTLLFLNGAVGFYEDLRSGDAVAALKASLKPVAVVKREGKWKKIDAGTLVPGERVGLNAGASIPADCRICEGMILQIDQAAMTGESLPVEMGVGDICKMGSTVVGGENEGIVACTGINTFFGKTAALIGSTHDVGNFQKVVVEITQMLLNLSSVLVTIAVAYLILRAPSEEAFWEAISFGVVLLVASIPIAMQVVCTATMALGSRLLAAQKAIVARLSSIEQLAGMTVLCSDKTGTLTLNKMVLQETVPYQEDCTDKTILTLSALATRWHEPAKDAIDTLVLNAPQVDRALLDKHKQLDFVPFSPVTKRTESTLLGPDGREFLVVKGAPHVVLHMCSAACQKAIEDEFNAKIENLASRGIRALAIARKYKGEEMEMAGIFTFLDPPRPDTKETIRRAMMQGVIVKMITGDHRAIAKETARSLGMGDNIGTAAGLPNIKPGDAISDTLGAQYGEMCEKADGFAQVFPEHKFLIVEVLRQRGWSVGMTGDGVNDAPALKKADVGIAVQGATDAARAAADLVLTAEGLSVIVDAIIISRCIFQRMKNYVIYRVACTVQLLVFFFVAVFVFHPPINDEINKKLPGHPHSYPVPGMEGVNQEYGFTMTMAEYGLDIPKEFNLPVIALVVIVILNDATIISTAYDHVKPSALPERWNLQVLFIVAIWIGLVACVSSLWLLDLALKSEDPSSLIRQFIPGPLSYGQVVAIMYLKISLSDWWTIFAARTRGFFFERAPSTIVLCAASLATMVSTLNSMYWPFQHLEFEKEKYEAHLNFDIQIVGLELPTVAFTWCFTLIFFVLQDICKVICYYVLFKFDVCGIRSEQEANDDRVRVNNELQEKLKEKDGQPWMKELMALKTEVAELKDMLKKSIGKPGKKNELV